MESLRHFGLDSLRQASFQELSRGQKQRVLIARALAAEPYVLVLDEPTSGMDVASEKHLMQLIKTLHESKRLIIVLATHNLNVVAQYAHQLGMVTPAGLLLDDCAWRLKEISCFSLVVEATHRVTFLYVYTENQTRLSD